LDFTAKQWGQWQDVVDMMPNTQFVQIGMKAPGHFHPQLKGNNVIDWVGKSTVRGLILLIYHCAGVLTPISCPTWLSLATPAKHGRSRPCITIIGGREPVHYIQNPNQQVCHTTGMLSCCDHGGCWKSRIVPLGDKDEKDKSLCVNPVQVNGMWVGKCMQMIKPEEVCNLMRKYSYD